MGRPILDKEKMKGRQSKRDKSEELAFLREKEKKEPWIRKRILRPLEYDLNGTNPNLFLFFIFFR